MVDDDQPGREVLKLLDPDLVMEAVESYVADFGWSFWWMDSTVTQTALEWK